MNKRNLSWLAAIIVVGAIVWIVASLTWGLITAGVLLIVSEISERLRRHRVAKATGEKVVSPLKTVARRRKR